MAEADLPGCFGPYLRYAITTDYKYFESFDEKDFRLFLLVEYLVDETTDHAAAFETEMDDSQYLDHKPGIEFAPIDPDSRYVSKYTTMRTLKGAVERHTFSSWNTHVSRVELSLPVQRPPTRFAKKAPLRNRKPSHYPPTDVLIGVIDDGCPFAAAHFAKFVLSAAAGTRVRGIWDQNRGRFPISVDSNTQFGEFLTDFNYGLEFLRDSEPPTPGTRTIGLNDWIGLHSTTAGSVDEDGCYAEAKFDSLLSRYSHGAHVMDVVAGRVPISARIGRRDPPSWQPDGDNAAGADVVFVQFSEECIRDATGVWLKAYVLDGIGYILSFVDPSKTKNVIINVSYGPTTGPHDGTAELESALLDLVHFYDGSAGKLKLEIFLPGGNAYLSDGHIAFVRKTEAEPKHVEWTWRILPDNSVLCFAEVWMKTSDVTNDVIVKLTSPSGLVSTSTTGPIPPPDGIPDPSYTGVYQRRIWGDNTVWLIAVEPTTVRSGFVPEHGDWTIRIDGLCVNADVDAYVARTDPNLGVRSGARHSSFVDPRWERTRAAAASCTRVNGEFDKRGSLISRDGTLNGIATTDDPSVQVAGGFVMIDGRKAPYSSAGPARKSPRRGPDFALPCDESDALQGIRAGGTRSGSTFRLIGTSVAAPQLARQIVKTTTGASFPTPNQVPTSPEEIAKRGGGNVDPP
jgi:hypothetical protein